MIFSNQYIRRTKVCIPAYLFWFKYQLYRYYSRKVWRNHDHCMMRTLHWYYKHSTPYLFDREMIKKCTFLNDASTKYHDIVVLGKQYKRVSTYKFSYLCWKAWMKKWISNFEVFYVLYEKKVNLRKMWNFDLCWLLQSPSNFTILCKT